MTENNRRTFLKLMGAPAVAAALPGSISRALDIDAHSPTGTIADVGHVVIFMQENRSFDHYFGTMRGVRGFADPRVVRLPSGLSAFHQPDGANYLLPFRPPVEDLGATFLPDPPHGWNDTHAAWNAGRHDQFVPNKGVQTMTYHTRADLPYQYALADAFTICDNYYCSLLGPTDPNRYHMWTGWVGNDGNGGGPVITNAEAGYDWSTYPERLQRNGISWKVYQDQGVGLDAAGFWGWTGDPFIGNYGDNSLLYFHQYQNAAPGTPLADRAKTGTLISAENRDPEKLLDIFRDDVRSGKLPKVSWIVAPEAYTEHPNWEPDFGAWYLSQIIDILAASPDVFSKTALFITYDEEGGFFDHLVPPTPPQSRAEGLSTVPTTNEIFPGDTDFVSAPYGFGMRVPMLVVSPWSRGGWVDSQLFDHTSLIRFLEERFAKGRPDLIESNITPWRRAVSGDLTNAFDFKKPNLLRRLMLPSTVDDKPEVLERQPDEVPVPPTNQSLPRQERGVKRARALPYELHVNGSVAASGSFRLNFRNTGDQAAVFQVRTPGADAPRTYTVERRQHVSDDWNTAEYDLTVHGPNGFLRSFKGGPANEGHAELEVRATYGAAGKGITLEITNRARSQADVRIANNNAHTQARVILAEGESASRHWPLSLTHGWYDFVITAADDPSFERQLAGHIESGEDSITDPLMGGLVE